MQEQIKQVFPVNIEDELKKSYLDYAMSVIVGRALPDARDGLKPVHRRVLFAMNELNNAWNKPHKKSARVVGDVVGKYHPHGDGPVYDTVVRMAQYFSLRYMLVDGQGNFGSVDGDSPAAMRYTEVRMSKLAHELLADLDKNTVDFSPNYDGTESIPDVLPTKIPNLLVNGSSGIAVGMATNIPPHNLTEVINGCLAYIDNSEISVEELMQHVSGPDFPTGAIINGKAGIVDAYKTGRGKIYIRSKHHIETDRSGNKESLVFTEIPYQVNKARLIERIAELVKEKKLEGITGLRDESDKDGMRIVVELRRGEVADVVVNNLYTQTQLQSVYGINIVALVDGQPKTLNILNLLDIFVAHRREVVTRRISYDLAKARARAHVLEGLGVALVNIDEIISSIKSSGSPQEAKQKLLGKLWTHGIVKSMLEKTDINISKPEDLPEGFGMLDDGYKLTDIQAQAILDLKLHRLTGLEKDKISGEYEEVLAKIREHVEVLLDSDKLIAIIKEELQEIKENYGDERATMIQSAQHDLTREDLITEEDMVVTLSSEGYVKTQPLTSYQAQRRGGKGKAAAKVKDEDVIDKLVIASTHDTILCFSNRGKVYWLKVYQLPVGSRIAKGRPIVNLLPLESSEKITSILPIREFDADKYVFMATSRGIVKKVSLKDFSRPRANGIIAVDLTLDDELVGVNVTDGQRDIILFSDSGKAMRFDENDVRCVGRTARGVRGIRLKDSDRVISLIVLEEDAAVLTASSNGFGKRTLSTHFAKKGRGGQGVIAMQTNDRNGLMVCAVQVLDGDDIMLITNKGTLVRTRVSEISLVGRNTQGVRLINLSSDEELVSVQRVEELKDEDELEGGVDADASDSADDSDVADTTEL